MDYSKLEGKVIDLEADGVKGKGRVALVDPHIGITIMNNDDPDQYALCLILPGSPKFKKLLCSLPSEHSKILFDSICAQIEQGVISDRGLQEATDSFDKTYAHGKFPSANNCPF